MAEYSNTTLSADLTLAALAIQLGASLKARAYMLALAESCTGGLVSQEITSVAGSSAWFDRGFVTYSNCAKVEMLGVAEQTLINHGAVSEATALEMAKGALKNSHAQIAGSITGIAGPDGGTAEKPVGTVCFAWAEADSINQSTTSQNTASKNTTSQSATRLFIGNREEIRQQAAAFLMAKLIDQLNHS
jgi:nicotinamide-nucleotide amidase